ncbi:MAG: dethiobiotin synthase [Planctomycetes bacterium]|nr:dethiobiotin synthase [Planctomycetota bacterium]
MSLDGAFAEDLDALAAKGLRRPWPPERRAALVDFASNDYLGLARSPASIAAAREAVERFGAGGRAARLLGGGSALDGEVEATVADWLGAEAALFFPSGFQANVGLLGAIAGRGDFVVCDELAHASLIDGARASRAIVAWHGHADVEALERQLRGQAARAARRRIVVTESVFSMDGDLAPLQALLAACERHDAHLVVDEAHAVGLLGPERAGAAAAFARHPRLVARVVTGGKALGAAGALVAGGRALVELLANRARPFVFTTACSPTVPAAFLAGVAAVRANGAPAERALAAARRLAALLGLRAPAAAIVPVVLGETEGVLAAAAAAMEAGFDVRAVRPPTVPAGTSRLRVTCHAERTEADVDRLAATLRPFLVGSRASAPATPRPAERPWVVAGTDTNVGKTVVSALCTLGLANAAHGERAASYWKPVQTGSDDDTTTVRHLVGGARVQFERPLWSLPLPASPHEAAAAAGVRIDPAAVTAGMRERGGSTVVELAGGLLVPLDGAVTQIDVLAEVRPRLVLVARSGLGTLNHTLLALEALRRRGLEPAALFLVGPPHASNRATLRELSGVRHVLEVPPFELLCHEALAAWLAANPLPWLVDA